MVAAVTDSPFITPLDIAAVVNEYAGESRVRWSEEFQSFVTTDGTRYCAGDIEDICRGILREREKDGNEGV